MKFAPKFFQLVYFLFEDDQFVLCSETLALRLLLIVSDECYIASGKRPKIQWSKFSSEKIHEKYVIPLFSDLSEVEMCDLIVSKTDADKLSRMLIYNSLSLVSSVPTT